MSRKLTKEDFVARASEIHGNKYDYSQVDYKSNKTKVIIICPKHGPFLQVPSGHLSGRGCIKCSGKAKLSNEDFINEAKEVHGERYDYSKVVYKNGKTKVVIICPEHGLFLQTPNEHRRGSGCKLCGIESMKGKQRKAFTAFKKKAESVHGVGKYDYSNFEYTSSKIKGMIICQKHGSFWQTPDDHCNGGRGCRLCGIEERTASRRHNIEVFIKKAEQVHGSGRYNYAEFKYVNARTRGKIICPKHGPFLQIPDSHISGQGCKKCAVEASAELYRLDVETFKRNAIATHGNKYDYSLFSYIDSHTDGIIICPQHGEFSQRPDHHVGGAGCPVCKASKGEKKIRRILKKLKVNFQQEAKLYYNYPYDFWIPEKKLAIEFHGIQHYEVDGFFIRTEKQLRERKEVDHRKKEYILKKGWNFLEIPYWEYEKIESIIRFKLKSL